MEPTAASAQLAFLVEAVRRLGVPDPEGLAAGFGLRFGTSDDPEHRVPVGPMLSLLEAAGEVLGDPLVGLHAGSRVEPRGLLFYLLLSSPGLFEGLKAWARFASLPFDAQRIAVDRVGDSIEAVIALSDPSLARSATAVDYVVAMNLRTLRKVFSGLDVERVSLAHDEIGEPGEYARTLGCPVEFSAGRNAIRLSASIERSETTGADAAVARALLNSANRLAERLVPDDIETRVSAEVRLLLERGSKPGRAAVAARLGMAERTLQRRLDAEGVRFQEIRDRVRLALAQDLLAGGRMKIAAISRQLGFAETASFSRAFARWTGVAPAAFRDGMNQG